MAIEVGNVFEGRVTGVKPFGAFVALPEGRVGMVHISEVSNEFVQDIAAVLHDGDIVKVPKRPKAAAAPQKASRPPASPAGPVSCSISSKCSFPGASPRFFLCIVSRKNQLVKQPGRGAARALQPPLELPA